MLKDLLTKRRIKKRKLFDPYKNGISSYDVAYLSYRRLKEKLKARVYSYRKVLLGVTKNHSLLP